MCEQEMYRVLKPGGKLSFLDYVQLPAFNSSDAKHLELLRKVVKGVLTLSPGRNRTETGADRSNLRVEERGSDTNQSVERPDVE